MQQAGEAVQQSRQQLAQAGQEGQQGGEQGAPGGGQTLASGDQYGAGGMPGGKKGGKGGAMMAGAGSGPDAGYGTTNEKAPGHTMGYRPPRDRQADLRPGKRSRFEQVYAPERVASNRLDTQVRGKRGKGKSDYSTVRGAPEQSSAARPYYEVYSTYQRTAEEALAREDVPAAYKKHVRDYFDSLRP